jgi:hypothetical protein
MITKSILDMLEMETIEDYFDYIMQSRIDGQHTRARVLFNELSSPSDVGMNEQSQQTAFFDWAESTFYYEAQDSDEVSELQLLVDYFGNNPI